MAVVARGVNLGGPNGAAPLVAHIALYGNVAAIAGAERAADVFARETKAFIEPYILQGMNDKEIAKHLNEDGIATRRRGGKWHETSVRRVRLREV
jgi:hypothetical protein